MCPNRRECLPPWRAAAAPPAGAARQVGDGRVRALGRATALPVFSANALSSTDYAPDEILMTLALGAIVTSILASWIRGSHLSGADRSLGGGFGLLRAVLMIGAAALLSDLAEAREARWWTESQLIDKFDAVGDAIGALLPESWLDALRPEVVSGAQMEN